MNDDELDSLLAKSVLSGPERDRVLERVLQRVRPSGGATPGPLIAGGLVVMAAAAGTFFIVTGARRPPVAFSARGGEPADQPVDLVCSSATLNACPRGSHLLFRSYKRGYLAAYAQPEAGGERIWYFAADREAPFVDLPSVSDRPVERAVVVGPEHAPGAYAVHVLVGSRPLSVAEALDPTTAAVIASEVVRLEVTP